MSFSQNADVDPNATILGLFYDKDGELCQKMRRQNGETYVIKVPGPTKNNIPESAKNFIEFDEDFDERFSKTDTIPHDLSPSKTSPLINKAVAKELSKLTEVFSKNPEDSDIMMKALTKFIDIISAEHALLIRVVGSPESLAERKEPLDLKNSALFDYVQLQINVLKGPWLNVRDKITSSK